VLVQTLLNNSDYTKLTYESFNEKSSKQMLNKIEIFAVGLKMLGNRATENEPRDTELDHDFVDHLENGTF
jgi:hypothetical protein